MAALTAVPDLRHVASVLHWSDHIQPRLQLFEMTMALFINKGKENNQTWKMGFAALPYIVQTALEGTILVLATLGIHSGATFMNIRLSQYIINLLAKIAPPRFET